MGVSPKNGLWASCYNLPYTVLEASSGTTNLDGKDYIWTPDQRIALCQKFSLHSFLLYPVLILSKQNHNFVWIDWWTDRDWREILIAIGGRHISWRETLIAIGGRHIDWWETSIAIGGGHIVLKIVYPSIESGLSKCSYRKVYWGAWIDPALIEG